jgi:cytochrome c553
LLAGLLACCALWAGNAHAQSASNGLTIYNKTLVAGVKSCGACHGTPVEDPVIVRGANASKTKAAVASQARMTPLMGSLSDSDYNDLAAYIGTTLSVTPTYIVIAATPVVSVSTTTLTFTSQNIGTPSAAQTVTVSNAAGASGALRISTIATTAGSDFAVTGGTCAAGGSVAAGASCSINVSFKPTAVGTRSGTLTVTHNASGGSSSVSLSGSAVNTSPAISISPMSLTFTSVVATASAPLRVTVSNTGTSALVLSSLTLGGAQASDYSLAGSSTCAAGTSVAGSGSCVVDIVFKPAATGARSASLTIAHNAAGSPGSVSLAGTGTSAPVPGIALNSTALNLGQQPAGMTSAAQTVTLTNSGSAALVLGAITTTGTDAGDFVLGGTCASGASIAAQGSCTVTVAIKPLTLGAKSATLSIASNAPTGTATVSLTATSVNAPSPQVGLSQPAVGFGTVTFGVKSTPRTVTLSNIGTAPLTITSITSTSSEYAVTHNCPASLAAAASCTLSIVYTPVAANTAEAIVITTNAVSSPNSIVVTGLGTMASMPVLAWQPAATALNFAATVVGVSSASQSLTLVNQGPGTVTLNTLGMSGTDASSFAIASTSTCKAAATLAVGASCTVAVNFVPGATGAKSASLQIGSSGTPPGDIALTGSGASPGSASGTLTLGGTSLDFSSIAVASGQTSSPLTVALSNGSAAAVNVNSVTISGPFTINTSASGACATTSSTLAPGGSCNLSVVYAPTMAGGSTGTLTVTTATQTLTVALKGQANAATPKLAWPAGTSSLMFSSTLVGSSSATQTLSLSNQGPGSATLNAIGLSGADAASFAVTAASTCKAALVLNVGASCNVVLAFNPTAAGARSATLRVDSNATAAGDVVLSGSGLATPDGMLTADRSLLDFSATSVALGQTSQPMNVVISHGNTAVVAISKFEITGPFKIGSNNCPATPAALAVNSSCTLAVAYAPTSSGSATGKLTLTTATGQLIVVQLQGVSTPTASPVLVWQAGSAQALQFDATAVGATSPARMVTLLNQGPGAVNFTAIDTEGNDKASFVIASGGSCSVAAALAQGATCTIAVAFMPTAAGSLSGVLRIASNASAPAAVTLTGMANAAAGSSSLMADFVSLGFNAGNGQPSPMQVVQITNSSSMPLAISSIGTSGPFAVVPSASNACTTPLTLAPGGSCSLTLVFNAPDQAGSSSGMLTIQSASGDTETVALQGVAVVTNAGAADSGSGGGAASPLWVALLALAALATARTGRSSRTRPA